MEARYQLARLLADGRPRSGAVLAHGLGVSRHQLLRLVDELAALDLPVLVVRGRGYRLAAPLELLDAARILADIPSALRARLVALEVLEEVDSTNGYLLAHPERAAGGVLACVAETQTAGRGRRGRSWVSPFAANLYLSVLRRFHAGAAVLHGLSLCMGVAAARAVESLGVTGVSLKWPNDLCLDGRKLGGVLIEVSAAAGAADVVAGIGINIRVPDRARADIDQAFVDLHGVGVRVGRNRLAGRVLGEVLLAQERFQSEGFAGFREEWRLLDGLAGREVVLSGALGDLRGRADGVDDDGALLLRVNGRSRRIVSGEVSVRPVDEAAVGSTP